MSTTYHGFLCVRTSGCWAKFGLDRRESFGRLPDQISNTCCARFPLTARSKPVSRLILVTVNIYRGNII